MTLDKMDSYSQLSGLLYLLDNFEQPDESLLEIIISRTREIAHSDTTIKSILGVLELHQEHYFIESDLRLILETFQGRKDFHNRNIKITLPYRTSSTISTFERKRATKQILFILACTDKEFYQSIHCVRLLSQRYA